MVEAVPDKWFLMVWFVLGHSVQPPSVKCAEVAWNNCKVRGHSALKITCVFFPFYTGVQYSTGLIGQLAQEDTPWLVSSSFVRGLAFFWKWIVPNILGVIIF